jgi:hypothetical protein
MSGPFLLAAAIVAAALTGAQAQVDGGREAPKIGGPVAPLGLFSSAPLPPILPLILESGVRGAVGPGVLPIHLAAVQALADSSRRTWIIAGSRQTGEGLNESSDLRLGVVGEAGALLDAAQNRWDGVPNVSGAPDFTTRTAEEAVGRGLLIVAPRAPRPPSGTLPVLSAPWRTAVQLERLAKNPRPAGQTFRFAVIGDAEPGRFWFARALFNRRPGSFWAQLLRADATGADFIVQLGDMVSVGVIRNFMAFFRRLANLAIRTPYLTVIGNHDRHRPHGVTNDRVYRSAFGGTDYVLDRGGWRFVTIDNSAGRLTRAQLDWLKGVLSAQRPTVVFTHMPPAPLGEWTDIGFKGSGGFREGAEEFMALMSTNAVKRVYMGHIHALGVLDRGGVRYVLTGGGGSPLYPVPIADRFHHFLSVEVGPDGIVETVHRALGGSFRLR